MSTILLDTLRQRVAKAQRDLAEAGRRHGQFHPRWFEARQTYDDALNELRKAEKAAVGDAI